MFWLINVYLIELLIIEVEYEWLLVQTTTIYSPYLVSFLYAVRHVFYIYNSFIIIIFLDHTLYLSE